MAKQSDLEYMLQLDLKTSHKLSEGKILVDDYYRTLANLDRNPTQAELDLFYKMRNRLQVLADRYNIRQNDYKTNTAYKLSQWIDEATDSVTEWFKDVFGIGEPVTITTGILVATGAVISVGVIAYFVSEYYEETVVDYNDALDTIAEISETNPQLAAELAADLEAIQKQQNDNASETIFSKVGDGLKTALIVGSVAGAGYAVYKIYESSKS